MDIRESDYCLRAHGDPDLTAGAELWQETQEVGGGGEQPLCGGRQGGGEWEEVALWSQLCH